MQSLQRLYMVSLQLKYLKHIFDSKVVISVINYNILITIFSGASENRDTSAKVRYDKIISYLILFCYKISVCRFDSDLMINHTFYSSLQLCSSQEMSRICYICLSRGWSWRRFWCKYLNWIKVLKVDARWYRELV